MKSSRTPIGSPSRSITPRIVRKTPKKSRLSTNGGLYSKSCRFNRSPINHDILSSLNQNEIRLRISSLDELDIDILVSIFPQLRQISKIIIIPRSNQALSSRTQTPPIGSRHTNLYDKYPLTARAYEFSSSEHEKLTSKLVVGISKNFGYFRSLEVFEMSSIKLSGEMWAVLSKGLGYVYCIRSISLIECAISDEILSYFTSSFQYQRELVYLNLRGNFLSEESGFHLSRILSRQEEKRDEIVWAFGLRGGKADSDALDSGVEELILNNNSIGENAVYNICRALYQNTQLRHLDLSDNKLTTRAYQDIISMLHTNRTLLSLDLSSNTEQPSYILMKTIVTRLRSNLKTCYSTKPYIAEKWEPRVIELQRALEPALFSMDATPDQSYTTDKSCPNCKEYCSALQTYEHAILDYELQLKILQVENKRLKKGLQCLGLSGEGNDLVTLKNIEQAIVYLSSLLDKVEK
jgi:hypothetical protein